MPKTITYFIDEDPAQRDNTGWSLRDLLKGTDVEVRAMAPLPDFPSYAVVLTGQVAFLLDEKLSVGGDVLYDGHQLAAYIRSVRPDVPIWIVTAYPPDIVPAAAEPDIEAIICKRDLEPGTLPAERFRARFLRMIASYETALTAGARRLHELIVKGTQDGLTEEEAAELDRLDAKRQAPSHLLEARQGRDLEADIENLQKLLSSLEQQNGSHK